MMRWYKQGGRPYGGGRPQPGRGGYGHQQQAPYGAYQQPAPAVATTPNYSYPQQAPQQTQYAGYQVQLDT